MKTKIRTRKAKQKLLLQWEPGQDFTVDVTVLPPAETRFLKRSTIAIYLREPGWRPHPPQLLAAAE